MCDESSALGSTRYWVASPPAIAGWALQELSCDVCSPLAYVIEQTDLPWLPIEEARHGEICEKIASVGPWRWNPIDDLLPDASYYTRRHRLHSGRPLFGKSWERSAASQYGPLASDTVHKYLNNQSFVPILG